MEEKTSNPSGRSNKNKIDRSKYTKAETNNVSWDELNEVIDSKGFEKLDLNSMAVSFNDNVKVKGGDAEENDYVMSTSYATYEFDLESIKDMSVNIRARAITDKNKDAIAKARAKKKKEKADKDAKSLIEKENGSEK